MPFRFNQRSRSSGNQTSHDIITVVSGLPRSGTSMMMRMLEAGGVPILTDYERRPDDSNPKGYYELESVKRMKEGEIAWIHEAQGKAVKIISPLLEFLPPEHQYQIIFMQRNMREILASQREMLVQRGEQDDRVGDRYLADLYQKHLEKTISWIEKQPNLRAIYIHYNKIVLDPRPSVVELTRFLNLTQNEMPKMLAVVESSLYRQRESKKDTLLRPNT
jgi:hypothetical protein